MSYHAQDMFAPQVPFEVPGVGRVVHPDVYFLRTVAHNWPDKEVRE